MHSNIIDAIDYVVSVSAMSWLNKSDGTSDSAVAVLRDADMVGQSIFDEYASAMTGWGHHEAPHAYEWRPVYQLAIQPSLARHGIAAATVEQATIRARLEQLDRCRRYLVEICSRSTSWEGSPAQVHLAQLADQLQARLQEAPPAREAA